MSSKNSSQSSAGPASEAGAAPEGAVNLGKDARYQAFLQVVADLRPRLHRYCSRITGSALDGEDVVQETLFQAYRHLDQYDERRSMGPWLMGIAHNRCLDLLRRRKVRIGIEGDSSAAPEPAAAPESHARLHVPAPLERLVLKLPPKERACMLLKEVFEYSLEETAAVVGSTLGGVKAALHRGRAKLVDTREAERPSRPPSAEDLRVLHLYVERFNQRDWNGVLELTRANARLHVADAYKGPFTESSGYFSNYQRATIPWRLAVGFVDGEPVVLTLRETRSEQWTPASATRIGLQDRRIAEIRDYGHCPWVLSAATSVEVSTSH